MTVQQGDWNKNSIEALLQRNYLAVERAIIVLHDRQTEDEKQSQTTKHHNKRGFGGTDATFLSSLADQIKRGRRLTDRQLACVRKRNKAGFSMLAKYHRQLLEEAAQRAQPKELAA